MTRSALSSLYQSAMRLVTPLLERLLMRRLAAGKEEPARIAERKGIPSRPRPEGALVWVHAASVGESLSTLILIDALHRTYPHIHVLVTTGTVTSAAMMDKRLPDRAFHQYIPLDQPDWVDRFLHHWRPDLVLWMESELWPSMLSAIKARGLPAALLNARMSKRSASRWRLAKGFADSVLETFSIIITQTSDDEAQYKSLGAKHVVTTSNLKYSSAPLPVDAAERERVKRAINGRPCWVYASSHAGEESLAGRVHLRLRTDIPNLLTIIVPRHVQRRHDITAICDALSLSHTLRGEEKHPPRMTDDIYIADTMGELGLFYSLADIALIGRSFSDDGGGGHNPVEAAQLGCAVLTGPNVQYQQQMFDDMFAENAALQVRTEMELYHTLRRLLTDAGECTAYKENAVRFAEEKSHVIDKVMDNLRPCLSVLEKHDAA